MKDMDASKFAIAENRAAAGSENAVAPWCPWIKAIRIYKFTDLVARKVVIVCASLSAAGHSALCLSCPKSLVSITLDSNRFVSNCRVSVVSEVR